MTIKEYIHDQFITGNLSRKEYNSYMDELESYRQDLGEQIER